MITKALLNNVKQYKKRDASMDCQGKMKGVVKNGVRLPVIHNMLGGQQKCMK